MWKAFLLLACVASSSIIVSCNETKSTCVTKPTRETAPTKETNPTGETGPTKETNPTGETNPTNETGPTEETEPWRRGCGGYPPICRKNEVYYNCSGGCVPRRCSEIGFPLNCDKKCTPGCVCKDGYVRADNGNCIPIADCPSCGGDKNAQQGCGNHCGNTCSTYNKPPRACPLFCIFNGCNCKKGFVYDINIKACVRPEDCTPICQANEEYSPCINGGCDARNCSQVGKPVPCVKLDPECCIKGCVCVKDYLRASNGTCVPKDQCTPKCEKPNEVYDECPASCPPRRCNVNEAVIKCAPPPKPGSPDCKPGCRCADSYYRNATGTCVPKKKCEKPLPCDGPNEVYNACPATCPPQKCGINLAAVQCMRSPEYGDPNCRPSCICIDGYVRNDDNECIPRDKCPKCTGQNEYWDTCIQGCSNQTCGSINQTYFCPYQKGCKSGCRCNPGFYRNDDNVCIPEDECPKTCGKNEHWKKCYYSCGGSQSCDDIGKKYSCPARQECLSGCRCDKGYWRNADNICVPESECCNPPICRQNEVYYNCSGGCVPRRCSEVGFPLNCDKKCTPGCVCKDGYVRADNGNCIPIADCPSCGGDKNAQQGCGNHCGNTCSTYNKPPRACPLFCIFNGCNCKKGFVYDINIKACVRPEDCTPICQANEEYSPCINGGCDARNCSQVGKPVPCVKLDPECCIKGCVCVKDYLRASNGTCVPKDQCTPKCEKPNEVYDECPASCPPRRCNVNEAVIKCAPPPKPGSPDCKSGCRCADSYYRNATGTCVPKRKCEKPLPCDGPNEVYNACPATCPPQKCGINLAAVQCMRSPEYGDPNCRPSCICIDGYVRNDDNECIPRDKCPKCTGQNEYWDTCIQGCSNQTCGSINQTYFCPYQKGCKSGCRCNPGFYRNDDNVCIPEDECPKTCGKNEHWKKCYYSCGGSQSCDDIGKKYSCPARQECLSGCRCDEGYWRNADNVCVPESECCNPPICRQNEVYYNCSGGCVPRRCSEVGFPLNCDMKCTPGCVCKDGYVRTDNGNCIPIPDCPSCGGDKNAQQGCSNHCGNTCSSYNKPPTPCPFFCIFNGCACRKGFVYDNNIKACVKPKDCTPICQANEEYSPCINGGCDARNCSQVGKPVPCVKLDPECCIKGCVCVKDYLRASNGTCVPKDQCTPKPCGQNEYWEECILGCSNQSCAELGRPAMSCPAEIEGQCPSGCRCKPKYYRNSDGVCIPESECPRCYGQNEYWENCIQGCSNQTCDDIGKVFHCPNQPAGECKSGCRCNQGTWRNASKVCVSQEECPKPDCPAGENWSWCPTVECDGDYCPKTRDSPQTCPVGIVCDKPRCVCESNRKRDWKTGKCISIKDCPKFKCNLNEEYQACPLPCPAETCSVFINGPPRCPPYKSICRPQCRCIKDYYRDANGMCIPACDCPQETAITTTTETPMTGPSPGGGGTGLTGILDGITAFTGLCLYNRMQSASSDNIIISPMSVLKPVAMLCLYSKGPALDQCLKILNLKDKQDIRDTYPKLDASYENPTGVNFSTAGKIYSDLKYKLSDDFNKDCKVVFNASAEEVDFSKNKEAADTINSWVESETNNRIQDLVSPDMLSALTRLVLVNAIYFKGTWLYTFNKNNTKEEDFYLSDGTTKKTQMMYQEIKDLDYGEVESLDCKAVRMYYKNKTSSMIVVLPNTNNGTMDLAKNLQDPANWKKVNDCFSPEKVQLYLPRYKITTTTDLKDLLIKAGIIDWFSPQNSGLDGILEKSEDISITDAIQKAFVEVNEEGSEAAAANAVVVTTRSLPFPPPVIKEFKANQGFLYFLRVGSIVTMCGAFNG